MYYAITAYNQNGKNTNIVEEKTAKKLLISEPHQYTNTQHLH